MRGDASFGIPSLYIKEAYSKILFPFTQNFGQRHSIFNIKQMGFDSRNPICLGKTYKVVCRAMCVKLLRASLLHCFRNTH